MFRHGGKQSSKTFRIEKEATRFAQTVDLIGADDALARLDPGTDSGPTVAELAEAWFEFQSTRVQPRTLADYRRDYANWIAPTLGHRPAAAITETDVQRWVDRDLKRLDAKTIRDRHSVLHGIYKWAAHPARAKVPYNPCLETDLPKVVKKSVKGLTFGEWLALKESMAAVDQDAYDLTLFMAYTGWRFGEATALMVRSVEDDGGPRVWVTMQQVQRKGVGIASGGKSLAAMRRIDVFGEAAEMVRRRVVGRAPTDLLFTNAAALSPTKIWGQAYRNHYWPKAVARAKLTERAPTPHWLRHTHVLICAKSGMTEVEISRRLGHQDIRVTFNLYGRMIGEAPIEVMDRMEAILSGASVIVRGEVVG